MFIVNVEGAVFREGKWLIIERSSQEEHAGGTLSLVGGKVDQEGHTTDILERTVKREIYEEVGVEVAERLEYVHSTSFVTDDGCHVVDVVFLCEYVSGDAHAKSPHEVEAVYWLTLEEILAHPKAPAWTKESMKRATEALKKHFQ